MPAPGERHTPTAQWFRGAGPLAAAYERTLARYHHLPVYATGPTRAPPARVTVVVPTLNEEDYVEDACRSLARQTLKRDWPDRVEILLVDSGSDDATRRLARPFVDGIVMAPRGKLTALMTAVGAARGDIILEADADGFFPPAWVDRMIAPFHDPRVAGVLGSFVYYDSPLLRVASQPMRHLLAAAGNFPGGVRAYRKEAFLAAGGFDTSIDQKDFWQVWPEEEFRFRRRLHRSGEVVRARHAICFKSARRGDPVFVRDPRADKFRRDLASSGRFQDGVTDRIYRVRKFVTELAR